MPILAMIRLYFDSKTGICHFKKISGGLYIGGVVIHFKPFNALFCHFQSDLRLLPNAKKSGGLL